MKFLTSQGDSRVWECPKCTISTLPFANTSSLSACDGDGLDEALIGILYVH